MSSIFYQYLEGAIARNEDHSRVAAAFERLENDEEIEEAKDLIVSLYDPEGAARIFDFVEDSKEIDEQEIRA